MASESAHVLAKCLHQFSSAGRMEGLPDRELVERFTSKRDEDAFAALVRRHGPMVLRVCHRVLHDPHAAEDVFQATFLVLSRKAASLRCAETIGCWLHGVAYRLAQNARMQRARRGRHESQAASERRAEDPLAELTVRESLTILDEELARLPKKYRAPLVVCCLEGRTRDEAAKELGWPVHLVKSRLEQGRERLRFRLSRRDLTLPAAMVATMLAEAAAPAALPGTLFRATVQIARTGFGDRASASVALLAETALRGAGAMKAKAIVGLMLLAGILTVGMAAFAPPQAPEKKAEATTATKEPEKPKAEKPQTARLLRVVVRDPQGKPLPDAKVHSSIWTHEKDFKANHDYKTDADGVAQVELPTSFYILRLWASKRTFADLYAGWEQNELASGTRLLTDYVFRMERAVTASGRILDEEGKPVRGAKVEVQIANAPKPTHGDGRVGYNTFLADRSNTTDAEGRWRIDNVPDQPRLELTFVVSHPDYVSDDYYGRRDAHKAAGITIDMLRRGTASVTLKRGVVVRGRVTNPTGKPIKDALVIYGDDPYFSWLPCKFPTDAEGRYRLPALAPSESTLTVLATGWAPQLRKVNLRSGMPAQDFHMVPGKPIRLRVVDSIGKPVPNAYVSILGWRGSKSLQSAHNPNHPKVPDTKIPRRATADGLWEWNWAPDDPVKLHVYSPGFSERELEIPGGASERKVVLKAEHRIIGRVTDATTGKPIPSFTVLQLDGFRKDWFVAERSHAVACKNGRLDYLADRTDVPLRLRVEAVGYRAQDGPEFRVGDDTSRSQDFRLQPSPPIAGIVRDTTGQPVAKAEVLLARAMEEIRLQQAMVNHKTITNDGGRFTFPDPNEPVIVVAQSEAGFALAELAAGKHDAGNLTLQPWASIRGQFRDGGRPVGDARLFVNLLRLDTVDRPRVNTVMLQTVTDREGRFEFPRVPPLPVSVRVSIGPWKDEGFRSGPSVPLNLKPGQRAELDLGGGATLVKGRVKLTGKMRADLNCTYSLNYLVERGPGIDPPPEIARLGFDARNGWRDSWTQSPEGLTYLSMLRHWFVKLAPDGVFRISGVPPGEYDLAIAVYAKPDG